MANPPARTCWKVIASLAFFAALAGCATTGGSGDPRDPYEDFNRSVTDFNDYMDRKFFKPIGKAYNNVTPGFIDRGVTNFFSNLDEISVIANDLLQFKLDQAVSDIARFVFNTTIGLFGFFDVSTALGLPKHNEDFGQTLAVWGMESSPYLVVPFFGPSTIRDVAGFGVDSTLFSPIISLTSDPYERVGLMALAVVDFKSDLLGTEALIDAAAVDKYEFTKNAFLERRNNQIHDREMSESLFEEDLYFEGE